MEQISYILSAEEVKEALYLAGVLKNYKKRMIFLITISFIVVVLSLIPLFNKPINEIFANPNTYLPTVALIIVNLFAYFGYKNNEKNTVRGSTTGENTVLTIYEDKINVVVKAYDADWDILKEDVSRVLNSENEIIIVLVDARLMAIPKRVLNDTNKPPLKKVLDYFCDISETEE